MTSSLVQGAPLFGAAQKLVYIFAAFTKEFNSSLESPDIELFESRKKLVWSLSEHSFFQISELCACSSIKVFLLMYITFSYVNWIKNGRLSKFNQENKI